MSHLGHRLSALIDGELDDAERDRALVHLARCDGCRREAVALRTLKQRMSALGGELSADSAFTHRLMGLPQAGSGFGAERAWPQPMGRGGLRDIRPAWFVALGCSAIFLTSAGTAAFMAGGGAAAPVAPQVTPQVDQYLTQYDLTNGVAPVTPSNTEANTSPRVMNNLKPRTSPAPAVSPAPVRVALRTAQLSLP